LHNAEAVIVVALVFGMITLPSVTIWTLMGQQLARLLTNNFRLRVFNGIMGALLIASLYPVLVSWLDQPG
jgi:threonine/homoserine/homoserine lactone efflux protein